MLTREAFEDFIDYIDPATFLDKNDNMVSMWRRKLLPDAPQSATDAFKEYQEMMFDAEKKGIYL